jgi:hypothetical protein
MIATQLGIQAAQCAKGYFDQILTAALGDADLKLEVQLWRPTFDPLTAPCWWQWRPPCDCPDTSFGRNPHRWNCDQTPIWAQTIRDLDTNPWTVVTR